MALHPCYRSVSDARLKISKNAEGPLNEPSRRRGQRQRLSLTPNEYAVLYSIGQTLSVSNVRGIGRFTIHDIVEGVKLNFGSTIDRRHVSRILLQLERRLGGEVIFREGKGNWIGDYEAVSNIVRNVSVRKDNRGSVGYSSLRVLERGERPINEFMGTGGLGGGKKEAEYCMSKNDVIKASKGAKVGEICVRPYTTYFDNVQMYDYNGNFVRGEVGVMGVDRLEYELSLGAMVRHMEVEMFLSDRYAEGVKGYLIMYRDRRYNVNKVSWKPPAGYFKGKGREGIARVIQDFYKNLLYQSLALISALQRSPSHVKESFNYLVCNGHELREIIKDLSKCRG